MEGVLSALPPLLLLFIIFPWIDSHIAAPLPASVFFEIDLPVVTNPIFATAGYSRYCVLHFSPSLTLFFEPLCEKL
jgi:hypothetical protein